MIIKNAYKPSFLLRNGHINTLFVAQFRTPPIVNYNRKRIITPDQDFLDIDFLEHSHKDKLVILLHGLESDTEQGYVKGAAKVLFDNGYSVAAVNQRGCSGEPNVHYYAYHSGFTQDLDFVFQSLEKEYEEVYLVGFSLGGNLILKYLGENKYPVSSKIKKAVAISVPCHFHDTALNLIEKPSNIIYRNHFLKKLKTKLKQKAIKFPKRITHEDIDKIKTLQDHDDFYIANAHGFKDAKDYWNQCGSIHFLKKIIVPTLLLNAQDDPFLTPSSFPVEIAKNHDFLHLEMPKYGGHVGFYQKSADNILWSEERIVSFLAS